MKKFTKILIAFGAMLALGTTSFAQRKCNLAPTLVSPTNNQTIPFGDTLKVSFTIQNNGPDAIMAGDTIFYDLQGGVYAYTTTANIANGAASPVIEGPIVFYNDTTVDITGSICVLLLDQSLITYNTNPPTPATITYSDTDTSNDQSCSNVTLKGDATPPTGIFNMGSVSKEQLNLYPNPANAEVMFTFNPDKAENVIVSVKDVTGREVARKDYGKINAGNTNSFKLNVANLNSGLYFIELNAGTTRAIGKITISR